MNTFITVFTNASPEMQSAMFGAATSEQRVVMGQVMSNNNVSNRNGDKTEKLAKKVIEQKNEKKQVFQINLESKSINLLITGPTQAGKTSVTIDFINTCMRQEPPVPVILSTDNKTDQQEQMFERINSKIFDTETVLLKASNKYFEKDLKKCIETGNNKFIIFCLDNFAQIEKVISNLSAGYTRYPIMSKNIKKIALIHDEADTVAKDQDTNEIKANQAASHKKWVELVNLVINKQMGTIDLKRVFITATPENVCSLYDIKTPDVIRLEIPGTYTGYKQINHCEIEDGEELYEQIEAEVDKCNDLGTYEAIIINIDRQIVKGQEVLLKNFVGLNCTVCTYNGEGITTKIHYQFKSAFEKALKKSAIKFEKVGKYFKIKGMSIRLFYTMLKAAGENCVVTIGKDLISRGISYVGEDTFEPITATTMFYKTGKNMHAVGICQTIGRITGCAGFGLVRTLYCDTSVYDEYIKYNQDQEVYLKKIEQSDSLTKTVVANLPRRKSERPLDRPNLKLDEAIEKERAKLPKLKVVVESDSSQYESEIETEDRMQGLIDMWWGKKTIIGRILSYVYENEDTNEEDLKEFIEECGSKDSNKMYHHLISNTKEYKLVFKRKNNITNLTKEARNYIDEME